MDTAAPGLLNRDEMESRRLLAAQDLQTGLSQSQVARKFGVSRTTASRWNHTLSGTGVESLELCLPRRRRCHHPGGRLHPRMPAAPGSAALRHPARRRKTGGESAVAETIGAGIVALARLLSSDRLKAK